jgi:hypothetical protein
MGKAADSDTLSEILSRLTGLEVQSKTSAEMTKLIDARIAKLDEHHDRHTEVLDALRSRMDRLDGAKGLAMVLIAVVGALGSIAGWLFGKM